jgi:hypothetical protein
MKMVSKKIKLIILVVPFLFQIAFSQEKPCSEPVISVELIEFSDYTLELLNELYPDKSKSDWTRDLHDKVLNELKKNSPDILFESGGGTDYEYCFRYLFNVNKGGEDKEFEGAVYCEYLNFLMGSRISSTNACWGGAGNDIIQLETTEDYQDIYKTVEVNIAAYGDMSVLIKKYEQSHLVPPRDPQLEISQNREFVSPLEEERSIEILFKVINCKGESVYSIKPGQPVVIPKQTIRGFTKFTDLHMPNYMPTSDDHIILIRKPEGSSVEYTLLRGMNPGEDVIDLTTCGFGMEVSEVRSIEIKGLEIILKSEKDILCPEEKTKIFVDFNRVDVEGTRTPVIGKKVKLNIDGIVDGKITPSDYVMTDENGRSILTYVAGEKDNFVTVEAMYQPKDFDGFVRDRVIINASCDWEWSGSMTVEKLERFDCELEVSKDNFWQLENYHELSTTRGTFSIQAENIDDSPPGFNINMGENIIVSGFMKCEYNNTEVSDTKKSGLSSYTTHLEETLVGEDLFKLSHKNLNLMFMSNLEDIQKDGSLEEMEKMLESGNIDQAKLEAFGKKFEESMGTGDEGASKITVIMQLFGDCNCKATLTQTSWGVNNKGERTDTSQSTTLDMAIGGGVALDFTADYVRNKDGSATITGNYSKITPIEGGKREGCPPRIETITCTLNLSKRAKK